MASGDILTPEGGKYSINALRTNYRQCLKELRDFQKKRGIIYLSDINVAWGDKFRVFLMRKNLSKNTIAIRLSAVKAVLKRLYNENISPFSGSGIRTGIEMTTTVYSTISELKKIHTHDLSKTPGMERIRDIYVLHCFVGLRVVDLNTLLQDVTKYIRHEAGKMFFEIKTKKTGEVVSIPVASIVKDIMIKRNNNFGRKFSEQYYNNTIKQLGKYLNINNQIVHSITKGGERVDTVKSKYTMMSSHTARRSFATNAYLAGVPVMAIMNITGHKTMNSFLRYIRCSSLESAISVADHPFFDQKI